MKYKTVSKLLIFVYMFAVVSCDESKSIKTKVDNSWEIIKITSKKNPPDTLDSTQNYPATFIKVHITYTGEMPKVSPKVCRLYDPKNKEIMVTNNKPNFMSSQESKYVCLNSYGTNEKKITYTFRVHPDYYRSTHQIDHESELVFDAILEANNLPQLLIEKSLKP